MEKISAIIITFRRIHLLQKCLESIEQDDQMPDEIIVGINGEDEETKTFLEGRSRIKIVQMSARTPGEARNLCIHEARGHFVVFLDDDTTLPPDYFKQGRRIIRETLICDVFGGPDCTPLDATFFEVALGLCLASPMATANTRFRHDAMIDNVQIKACEKKLILCNLWCRRSLFTEEGYHFNPHFYRNEENVLLYELKKNNKAIGFYSNLFVYHKRKVNGYQLMKAVFSSGKHRMRSFLFFPKSFEIPYIMPSLCLLVFLFLLILDLQLAAWMMSCYFAMSIFVTIWLIILRRSRFLYMPAIIYFQIIINLCYANGVLFEFVTRLVTGTYGLARITKSNPRKT